MLWIQYGTYRVHTLAMDWYQTIGHFRANMAILDLSKGILCFLGNLKFCSDLCGFLGMTKVIPGISPVQQDNIEAFWASKREIWLRTAICKGRKQLLRRFCAFI